ncbi:MAG: 50S ribosomal protein L25 [Desulfurivibrio sp.]|nr:50S ribosomal protein L25 [Desulfurivibrio sp.]
MIQIEMKARVRKTIGKGAARTMRRAGNTPAVIYGPQGAPLSLECNTKDLTQSLLSIHRKNAFINLEIDEDGKKSVRHVITREIQTNPVHDNVLHADFYEVSLEKPLVFQVPLKYVGKAKGVDMVGDMTIAKNKVSVSGKLLDIPDVIEIDVTPLDLGAALTCKDLGLTAGISLVSKGDTVCVSISGSAE